MNVLKKLIKVLMIAGSLNWGLIGFFDFNLVNAIFGSIPTLEKIVYLLVGLSGVYGIFMLFKGCDEKK